jgi:mRNA interferase MazF
MRLAAAPGNVTLKSEQTGLSKDSVVNISQVLTLDKNYLRDKTAELRGTVMRMVDEGLRLALDL